MFEISKSKDIESLKIKEAKTLEKKRKKSGRNKERQKNLLTGPVKGWKENYYNDEVNKRKDPRIKDSKEEEKKRKKAQKKCSE